MDENTTYIHNLEEKLEKYSDTLSKIDSVLSDYESRGKTHLISESKGLREKYKEAETMVRSLKDSAADDFEDLKEASMALVSDLKDGLRQFGSLLSMDKILHAKDEVVQYGRGTISETEEYVKKNPFTTAAIALAAGFIIGALLRREK